MHSEIKHKDKELSSGAAKGAKSVATARNTTQKYIELLGQHSAAFDASGGRIDAQNDPYVIHRGIQHRLHKQVLEENNSRQDLISVQNNFRDFEGHVIQTIQQAMSAFSQQVGGQAERQKSLYTDMVGTSSRIPLDFEWSKFLHRNSSLMIDPSSPERSIEHINYPNQDHPSTKPLISGTLERKGRGVGALTGYKTGHYVVTRAKYLHQFDDDDNFRKDPSAELSLYLPECTVGAIAGEKFNIKGKDVSKGKVGTALQMNHEFSFKAHSPADAQKWHAIISEAAGASNITTDLPSAENSPISPRSAAGPPGYSEKQAPPLQTQGLPAGQSQSSAAPHSATTAPQSAGPAAGHSA